MRPVPVKTRLMSIRLPPTRSRRSYRRPTREVRVAGRALGAERPAERQVDLGPGDDVLSWVERDGDVRAIEPARDREHAPYRGRSRPEELADVDGHLSRL